MCEYKVIFGHTSSDDLLYRRIDCLYIAERYIRKIYVEILLDPPRSVIQGIIYDLAVIFLGEIVIVVPYCSPTANKASFK